MKKARKAVKEDDFDKTTEQLKEARTRFLSLKTMINLTQADRASQQTHILNRTLNTADKDAGAMSY